MCILGDSGTVIDKVLLKLGSGFRLSFLTGDVLEDVL